MSGLLHSAAAIAFSLVGILPLSGQTSPESETCRSAGLRALQQINPAVKDIWLDLDGLTVAKANAKIEEVPLRTVVIGEAYLEKGKDDTRRTFLCLLGEGGKVLLTFFTEK